MFRIRAIAYSIVPLALLLALTFPPQAFSESIFLPPHNNELYKKDRSLLNDSEYWRIKIFGLRMVPLDPEVWAIRKIDRTDNRRLVPIRPYYLRVSEDPTFALDTIDLTFQLSKVSSQEAIRVPFRRDALLEIEFAGKFAEGRPFSEPLEDEAYGLRLSAFPAMPAGFYFRSRTEYRMLKEFSPNQIVSGRDSKVAVSLTDRNVQVSLDGQILGELSGANLRHGLVSFETGWHPVAITELVIAGVSQGGDGKLQQHKFSGVVKIPKNPPPKSRKGTKK